MLHELRVENLLLLEAAELRPAPGLNVLTGETGAGKTLLAQALDLLLGGRARSGIVRADAAEAYVEGSFSLPPELRADERIPLDAQEVVLARRVWRDGRTRAYVCGRSATVGDLKELGSRLVAFYGQHEHRKLMLSEAQLDVLDHHCGERQLLLRAEVASAYERMCEIRRRLERLRELAGNRERELDLLGFELEEIDGAGVGEAEEALLSEERERLRNVELLRGAATGAAERLSSEASTGVLESLAGACAELDRASTADPQLAALGERMSTLRYEAEELGRELRDYAMGLEGSPARLEEVDERLAVYARLKRKYGGSVEEILRHAESCAARKEELENAEVALGAAAGELEAVNAELERVASELSDQRRRAAPMLAAAVEERLGELAMAEAKFEIVVSPREGGIGPRGMDRVEAMIAPNTGVPARPLREIASGGELSRVMLALLGVAHGREEGPAGSLLVFDEVDAGIGGQTARAVGAHLRSLASGRQVLCITHLPPVAALADRHFTIAKDQSVHPARTVVTALDGDSVVGELVRMLGAGEGDAAASRHARQLLRAA